MNKGRLKPLKVAIDKLTIVGDLKNIAHADNFIEYIQSIGFERQERDSRNYGYGKVYKHHEIGYIEFAHQLNDGKTDHQRISDDLTRVEKQIELIEKHGALDYLPSKSELLEQEAELNDRLAECDERGYIKRIRDVRYEFNPKYGEYGDNAEQNKQNMEELIMNMHNKDVTSIHIAQDYAVHVNTLRVVDYKARRENTFYGKDKQLQTRYFGSRSNKVQQVMYNKKQENEDNGTLEQYEDIEHVTRIETRIKGKNEVNEFLSGEYNPMKELKIVTFLKSKVEKLDIDEQWAIEGIRRALKEGKNPFAGLSHHKKNKFKALFESVTMTKIDIENDWEKERSRILGEVDGSLNS